MVALLLLALGLARHPLHASSATVRLDPESRTVLVELRAFADDFPPGHDSLAAVGYLAQRFRLSDGSGRRVGLELRGIRADGAMLVCLMTGPAPNGLRGGRIWHGVLAEKFPDQVNLVRVSIAGRAASVLFTPGDGPKPLP